MNCAFLIRTKNRISVKSLELDTTCEKRRINKNTYEIEYQNA